MTFCFVHHHVIDPEERGALQGEPAVGASGECQRAAGDHAPRAKKQRGETVGRWVLKTPAHLGYLPELRAAFPDLHLVHMHRDPRATIASGASLNATLHAMHMTSFDPRVVGAEWLERMGWANDRALAAREGRETLEQSIEALASLPFVDVLYVRCDCCGDEHCFSVKDALPQAA